MQITINYWAVVGAAVANMAVGMLWYGPLFGKQWKKMMGLTNEDMCKMPLTAAQAITGGAVTALIMSYVVSYEAYVWGNFTGESGTVFFAFMLAFWPWLGYIATTQAGGWLWEGKSFKLFLLNAAGSLASLFAITLVLTFA